MTIKIGDATLATLPRPGDLDAVLIEATGRNAAETAAALAGEPLAGHVAQALAPFLKDRPVIAELADAIARAGTAEVAATVRALYAAPVPAGKAIPSE